MKPDYFFSLLPIAAAIALPLRERDLVPPDRCCFTLRDTSTDQILKQAKNNGFVILSGDGPDGRYCINLSDPSDILRDASNNACFINPDQAFQCLDPIPSSDAWSIQNAREGALVAVNGRTDFNACGDGVYTNDKGGCRGLKLKASGLQGSCEGLSG
ncbi:hypothetical protein E4U42_006518 [Claviceps africana]|uniref:Uncharacterized protein n=1 Tax=Claviceps africana TaxID=83212 RepID=A0A8K0J2I8_9HYPO|nr:hypothetical protein E4U42_006518 [Claviceps africana]